ncbi:MAG: hypothetical protein A7316_04685 [Candidatus Altiarchaeales archaeon WOR_SM1_86-2]|nr:MAG: hypothetical protein A7316_04685 [Candidatus Altiarchaeales archaeon WOR_SM1_86-2]
MNHTKRPKIFIDSNIIISGTFFSGLESTLLSMEDVDLITADICKEEVLEVTKRKFRSFGVETLRIALEEVENSFSDVIIISENDYAHNIEKAKNLIKDKVNDQKVLAAVLTIKPDYFVTCDKDFDNVEIKNKINVVKTREVLGGFVSY